VRYVAVAAFLLGLLLWVRVMFFGVRRVEAERQYHRKWPLALSAFLTVGGALLYAASRSGPVTAGWAVVVLLSAGIAALGAWWLVRHSAAIPSTDPDDDPRYRFQGHVAKIVQRITDDGAGRVAFEFDGERLEFRARWTPAAELPANRAPLGAVGAEVVIETVDGDLALVEPWVLVEERL
jgi:hypothetical protein